MSEDQAFWALISWGLLNFVVGLVLGFMVRHKLGKKYERP